jgi:acetylornithine deacetylase/succinyl-diaminopimelate desuccinylase-like protein
MRDLFVTWCTEAGCAVAVDRIGNIFTPCRVGVSHNEAEHAELDATSPGVNVLLHAVLARASC